MNFDFLSGIFSKIVEFAVAKPFMAFAISTATLTGATVTGVVVHELVQDKEVSTTVNKTKEDTTSKTSIKDENKDKSDNLSEDISDEEIEELLENGDENTNEEDTTEENNEPTSEIAGNNTNSSNATINKGTTSSNTQTNNVNTNNSNTSTNKPGSSTTTNSNGNTQNSNQTVNNSNTNNNSNNGNSSSTVTKPVRPSGIDTSLSQQCYASIASVTANANYPEIRNTLDNLIDDLLFNQKASGSTVQNALANYKYKGYNVVFRTQFKEVILPDGFAISDFRNQISKQVTDNYLYVKVYWNSNTNKYHAYYIAGALSHDVIAEANDYPLA